jgi:hypothetical protein
LLHTVQASWNPPPSGYFYALSQPVCSRLCHRIIEIRFPPFI